MRHVSIGEKAASVIGFGGWAIGGDAYGPVSMREASSALLRAFELGVTLYDSANIYGNGRSERLIARLARGRRDRLILTSKGGYVDYARKLQDFSAASLASALEGSLRRLETDYVDVYYLHSPSREVLLDGAAFDTLRTFVRQGRVRLTGVSVRTVEDAALLLAATPPPMDVLQLPFSLVAPEAARTGLLRAARRARIHVVARAPLCHGFLATTRPSRFGARDHRARLSPDTRRRWSNVADCLSWLEIPGTRTLAQAALQFDLLHEGVTAVIPGAKNQRQVEENVATLHSASLTDAELRKAADFIGV